jgi:diketogulonate reductase-like aldo/keto reductase
MAMESVVGIDGNARRIGLSNIFPNDLLDIIKFVDERPADSYPPPRKPDVIQAFADPLSPNLEIRRVCEEHGIEFVSYSTLGTQHQGVTVNPVLGSPVVNDLSAKYGRSIAEVVLSWALQRNMSVIPRSSKMNHIKELAKLMKGEPFLEEADLLKIDAMKGQKAQS